MRFGRRKDERLPDEGAGVPEAQRPDAQGPGGPGPDARGPGERRPGGTEPDGGPDAAGSRDAPEYPRAGARRYGEPVYVPQRQPYVRQPPSYAGGEQPVRPEPPAQPGRPGPPLPGRWDRIVVGRAAPVFEPKPPPVDPYRPDTVYDGWSTPRITVRLASVRGDAHRFDGRPRQDDLAIAVHLPSGTVVFAVADGVSSAPLSHVGAALASRAAVRYLLTELDKGGTEPDWERVLSAAAWQLFLRTSGGADPTDAQRHETQRQLATTLVAGTVEALPDGQLKVGMVQIGDTAAWRLRHGRYTPLLVPKGGEDEDIVTSSVVALPRVPAGPAVHRHVLPPDATLLVGTDGFGDPLGDGTGQIGRMLAEQLSRPPREPRTLAHLLDFSRETFDDDRTLLAVWPRHRLQEPRP
ncbi:MULTISPECIES: protein phosphatase 2C domain-containing protein [unclassified Streptomyces]|uniref:protein phosphatase 2C domain-containing protein n=1 Tax=Streptomyces sp. NPDC055082 TaxID=3365718 RepID=UPI0037D534E1